MEFYEHYLRAQQQHAGLQIVSDRELHEDELRRYGSVQQGAALSGLGAGVALGHSLRQDDDDELRFRKEFNRLHDICQPHEDVVVEYNLRSARQECRLVTKPGGLGLAGVKPEGALNPTYEPKGDFKSQLKAEVDGWLADVRL